MKISLIVISLFICSQIHAQQPVITGKVTEKDNSKPLPGATVNMLFQADSSLIESVAADSSGSFTITSPGRVNLIVTVSAVGYQQFVSFFKTDSTDHNIGLILMDKQGNDLAGVTIIGKVPTVTQKDDTTQYNASKYKVNPDATTEDLIKKMPGITVDKSGNVTAHGEQVKTVTVDGKRFFGDDATAALRNLPAEIVDKIQVFDKLSDQAQFTGFDDGSAQKSINIVTKTGTRNGQFGRVYEGYGTDSRYNAGGNISFFKGDRRLSIVGLLNNVNQQNFASEDLLGITSSSSGGSRGGGGNRGGGGVRQGGNTAGGFGAGNNFLVGQQNGISATSAIGINYGDKWFKKLDITGSYFFNNSNTDNNQLSNTQYFFNNARDEYYDENSFSTSDNFNHRINMRLEYKIDSANSILFSPSLSFQKNTADNIVSGIRYFPDKTNISSTDYARNAKTSGYNLNNNLLFRHALKKKGRTISLNLTYANNRRNGDTYLTSYNRFYIGLLNHDDSLNQYTDQLVIGNTYSGNLSYTEPIGKKGQLQFSYSPSVSKNNSDQEVFQFDNLNNKYALFDTSLSSKFDNTTTSHTINTSFRKGDRDNMFSLGLSYKYTLLESEQLFPQQASVTKPYNNLLLNAMFRKKFNTKSSMNLFYRASTNPPAVTQLQDVINNNNPLFLTTGNPELKQQVNNTLSGRFTYTNTAKSKTLFANLFAQQADNYISNATYTAAHDSILSNGVILQRGAQLTRPVNLNGFVNLRSFLTYGIPVKFIKSNLNLNAGLSWSKIPGLVNRSNSISNNYTYTGGAVVSSNISQYVDFTISYSGNFNVVRNNLQQLLNSDYLSQTAGLQINLLSKKGWFIQNDISNQSYSGLSAGFNQSYWLWNAAIGKKFLKNKAGELRLSVFDLLKQNSSITRTVTESYVEDVQNEVLTQYFMLTFSYKLKNFGTPKPPSATGRDGNRPAFPGM